MDVRGAINKRLTGVRLDARVPLGSAVSIDGTAMGSLTSVTSLSDETVGMGVLRKAAWEPGTAVSVQTETGDVPGVVVALPLRS